MAKIEIAGEKFEAEVDRTRGGGTFATRAGASIKMTPEGKMGFLEAQFGEGNVFTLDNGDIVIWDESTGKFVPFDEKGFSIKDVTADIVGPAIETAPMLAAGTNPATVAAAGAFGNAARQAVSAALPGDDQMSPEERIFSMGTTAALAGGLQFGVNTGAKVWEAIKPRNFAAKRFSAAMATPFAKKGLKLEEKTGIRLTAGEVSGHQGTQAVEAIARRMPSGADDFFQFQQEQLRTSVTKLKTQLDQLGEGGGEFKVGTDIIKSFDDAVDKAWQLRASQAKSDFDTLHRVSGGVPVVRTDGLRNTIASLVDELDVPGAGDATARVVNQAKRLLEQIEKNPNLTGEQVNRLLQIYTNAQRGTGLVFRDMDKQQSKFIAGKLKDAVLADIDNAIQSGGHAADVATALKVARSNYQLNSKAINELGDSTLARILGNRTSSPEAIAEKFVTKLKPSQVAQSMRIIEQASPETAQAIRRFFIEKAMENAKNIPVSKSGSAPGVKFSAAKFVSSLPDVATMRAAGFTRQEIADILRVSKALERIADKALEGSPTAPFAITWDAVKGLFSLNPFTLASGLGKAGAAVFGPKKIAQAVLTPQGRQSLMTLSQVKPGTKQALAAGMTLVSLIGLEGMNKADVRPLEQAQAR